MNRSGTSLRVIDGGRATLERELMWAAALGLSIVARYAQLMGGRLELATTHGAGLSASVWLPLANASNPSTQALPTNVAT